MQKPVQYVWQKEAVCQFLPFFFFFFKYVFKYFSSVLFSFSYMELAGWGEEAIAKHFI